MSKINADLYIVFAGLSHNPGFGISDSLGVFGRLVDAKTFYTTTGNAEGSWREHVTPLQVFGEEMHIATIRDGKLVLCSRFDESDGWKDV